MNGDVVNLRMARKRRDRAAKEASAERNRFEHGRTKTERNLTEAQNTKTRRDHEASRREPDAPKR